MSSEFLRPWRQSRLAQITWRLYNTQARALVCQGLLAGALGLFAWYVISNTAENLQTRGIASGFQFLLREAGFEISETTF
ncbi:MAG: hypothetical protein ACREQV_04865, partial [Candidatus Binatia bacterium]